MLQLAQRIRPKEVVEAYKATGLKARPTLYFQEVAIGDGSFVECGCAIGALLRQSGLGYKTEDLLSLRRLPWRYLSGFLQGFDEGIMAPSAAAEASGAGTDNDYRDGLRDGVDAHDAVTEADLWFVATIRYVR